MTKRSAVLAAVFVLCLFGMLGGLLHPGLRDFVYREISYEVVLDSFAGSEVDPWQIVKRANEYVHNEMYPGGGPVVDTDSWSHLVRGIGWCDQQSWTVGTLVALRGVEGRLVMLKDEHGVSRHTVLDVMHTGTWRVVDPYFGLTFEQTLEALSEEPVIVQTQPVVQRLAPEGKREVTQLYERVLPLRQTPVRWPSVRERRNSSSIKRLFVRAILRVKSGVGKTGVEAFQDLYLALLPERLEWLARDTAKDIQEGLSAVEAYAALRGYYRARNFHLYGRLEKAEQAYLSVVNQFPNSEHADRSRYWLGVAKIQAGKGYAGISKLSAFIRDVPESEWKARAFDWMARGYELEGDLEQARRFTGRALSDAKSAGALRLVRATVAGL